MSLPILPLTDEKELRIYMHPLRQRILHTMEVKGEPMTAKQLADTLSITPASAKHHLVQLESIGVVRVDHTQLIHGITATYYAPAPVAVSLAMDREEGARDRHLLAQHVLLQVFQGMTQKLEAIHAAGRTPDPRGTDAELRTAVVHLTPEEAAELAGQIRNFLETRREKGPGTVPYSVGILWYTPEDPT